MISHQPTDKGYLSDIRVTNISKSFAHKMAAKTSWHRYGTKLCHYHLCISGFLIRMKTIVKMRHGLLGQQPKGMCI